MTMERGQVFGWKLQCKSLKNNEIIMLEVALIVREIFAPFLHTGYFNILQQTDTEDKEKPLKIRRFQRLSSS